MTQHLLVRVGAMGHVGRFAAVDLTAYPRHSRVVCRTPRGLEVGEVLSQIEADQPAGDGTVLRHLGVEDELLLARLERNRDEAYAACVQLLQDRGLSATLMDVEHLFDGQTIYFYFLGEITEALADVTDELAEAYELKVQFRKFSETLLAGCGPDCGTESAAGCGSGGCATCAVAAACHKP